jgi:DNA-binding XRE family transcriptional regulator
MNRDLTQEQMAAVLHVPKPTYIAIENGLRNGNHLFWSKFQSTFKVADKDMWNLQKTQRSKSGA